MRRPKLQTAFAQGIVQAGALRIGDTQKDFQVVKRLEQEIGRTGPQRGPLGFLIRIRREHNHREKDFTAGGPQRINGSSIHPRAASSNRAGSLLS